MGVVQKIAREVSPRGAYTVIYYEDAQGKRVQRIPTSDREHADIRKIYRHDRPHPHIWNDFTGLKIGPDHD